MTAVILGAPEFAHTAINVVAKVERSRKGENRFAAWRAGTLCGVYVLIALHIAHWKITGRTLAPLELHEVMVTAELGIVTAGFLFMAAAVIGTLVFGRFFCSWGCHILALEDLCAWLLAKARIHPKPVRSRLLLLVAPAALVYMFVWPHVVRIAQGTPAPVFRVAGENERWASFVTTDFWRNLPSPLVALATFAVCGFAVVYLLGTRSFCKYVCPYGVLFGAADRFAPGRIRLKQGVDAQRCLDCGICTSVCQSHVRVHEELARHRMVVDSRCLRDLDCVAACPDGDLKFGLGPLALMKRRAAGPSYDFSWGEDLALGGVFAGAFVAFRGLYFGVPFLLALGLAVCVAYVAVLGARLATRPHLRLNNFQLKTQGALTRSGRGFALVAIVMVLATAHSGVVRYHEATGAREFAKLGRAAVQDPATRASAIRHLEAARTLGFVEPLELDRMLASLYTLEETPGSVEPLLRRIVGYDGSDWEARVRLARIELGKGGLDAAAEVLAPVVVAPRKSRTPVAIWVDACVLDAWVRRERNEPEAAVRALEAALEGDPNRSSARIALLELLAETRDGKRAQRVGSGADRAEDASYAEGLVRLACSDPNGARAELRQAVQRNPNHAGACYWLGRLSLDAGDNLAATGYLQRAASLGPGLAEAHYWLGVALHRRGREEEAQTCAEAARRLSARFESKPWP